MPATILSLATAIPPYHYLQSEAADKFAQILGIDEAKSNYIRQLYQNSAIHKRHSVLNDFNMERGEWSFWGPTFPQVIPGMQKRNEVYKKEAPKLAYEASKKAIDRWGGDPHSLTHIISISCTGIIAPGIEFTLMPLLDLNLSINRLGINFMGCFGAFKGLSVAHAFAKENPQNRILVVCTELCSLHLQTNLDSETLIANSLFADGSSAVIIGANPQPFENPLWEIANSHTMGLENSLDKMSWEAGDQGFLMRLSHTVPVYLGRSIKAFTDRLIPSSLKTEECDWAIHPGGKSILQAIEKTMKLNPSQTEAAWKTLANYGNMSSATFLFVLEELSKQLNQQKWAVGLAFGPGLSMEGVLLKRVEKIKT